MRLAIATIVLVMLACASAWAADTIACYTGSSEQGGNRLTVNGIQTSQFAQQSYPSASVSVFNHGTVTLASPIYADAGASQLLTNPFTSSSNGVAFWCAADGFYDVQYSGSGITAPFTVADIKLQFAGGGGGGGTGCVVNPADGGCAIAGTPSVDLFIGAVGAGTGWLTQLLSDRLNSKVPINVLGTNAGAVSLGCAPDPGLGSGIAIVAPATCTPYNFYWPQAAGSGFLRGSNASNKVTNVFQSSIDLTADVINLLPVANGGTGSASGSGALLNLFPTIIRNGDIICAAGSVWTTCPNTGGNSGTPAFLTENSGGTVGWVQVPIPPIDGGTGLTTMTLNCLYKGNTTSGMLLSSICDNGTTVTVTEPVNTTAYQTATNCAVNSASPAACGSAAAGAVVIPTTTTTYTINTTAVTAASRIQLTWLSFASNLPSAPTCVAPSPTTHPTVSAISAGVSFTIAMTSTTGQTCPMFQIVN